MENDTGAVEQTAAADQQVLTMTDMAMPDNTVVCHLHLSISCNGLINVDIGSLSDPFVVVKLQNEDRSWREIGRTEIIANNLNPKWIKLILVDYLFEQTQNLRFEVYDVAGNFSSNDASQLYLKDQNELGVAECPLPLIVSSAGSEWTTALKPFLHTERVVTLGSISVRAEEIPNHNAEVTMFLSVTGLPKVPTNTIFFGDPSPFIVISRKPEGGSYIPCHKTDVKKSTRSPMWSSFSVPLTILAAGDKYRPLLFEVWGWCKSGKHLPLSKLTKSVHDLEAASGKRICMTSLFGDSKPEMYIRECKMESAPTFFDYLLSGMELQFICAIDYTSSNGHPGSPDSLHYINKNGENNSYSKAISDIGTILEFYDTDKKFPVFGFGGKPHLGGIISHCFAVNGNEADPEVIGVAGIISSYYNSLSTVELSGPTLFAPVINKAATMAAALQTTDPRNQKYCILLIVTDGVIDDMANTKDAIVAAAKLPLSIIIAGVGNANFDSMKILDGDEVRITNSSNQPAARDIVQFVPVQDVVRRGSYSFATEVLRELPRSVVEYCKMMKIEPYRKSEQQGAFANADIQQTLRKQHCSFLDRQQSGAPKR